LRRTPSVTLNGGEARLTTEQANAVTHILHQPGEGHAARSRYRRHPLRPSLEIRSIANPDGDQLRDAALGVTGIRSFRAQGVVHGCGMSAQLVEHIGVARAACGTEGAR
jgi:hypothetical protein